MQSRVDWVEENGIKRPKYKKAPLSTWFTYPYDLLSKASDLYDTLGHVPSIKEVLYFDNSWHNQVLLWHEGKQWATDSIIDES